MYSTLHSQAVVDWRTRAQDTPFTLLASRCSPSWLLRLGLKRDAISLTYGSWQDDKEQQAEVMVEVGQASDLDELNPLLDDSSRSGAGSALAGPVELRALRLTQSVAINDDLRAGAGIAWTRAGGTWVLFMQHLFDNQKHTLSVSLEGLRGLASMRYTLGAGWSLLSSVQYEFNRNKPRSVNSRLFMGESDHVQVGAEYRVSQDVCVAVALDTDMRLMFNANATVFKGKTSSVQVQVQGTSSRLFIGASLDLHKLHFHQ